MTAELIETPLKNVWEIRGRSFKDQRGAFTNAFRIQEPVFQKVWGNRSISQVNVSCTKSVGTVRGLHYQAGPYSEAKLIRCLRGRVWDVAVDLRINSPTYGTWHAVELSPNLGNALIIPEGCAHGFQVLEAESELLYLHSGAWMPKFEKGIRWNDAKIGVQWPEPVVFLSERDQELPLLGDHS